jgi:hypothetical protein
LGWVPVQKVDALDESHLAILDDSLDAIAEECVHSLKDEKKMAVCRYNSLFYEAMEDMLDRVFCSGPWSRYVRMIEKWMSTTVAENRLVYSNVMRPLEVAEDDELMERVPEVAARFFWLTYLALCRYRRTTFAEEFEPYAGDSYYLIFFREHLV